MNVLVFWSCFDFRQWVLPIWIALEQSELFILILKKTEGTQGILSHQPVDCHRMQLVPVCVGVQPETCYFITIWSNWCSSELNPALAQTLISTPHSLPHAIMLAASAHFFLYHFQREREKCLSWTKIKTSGRGKRKIFNRAETVLVESLQRKTSADTRERKEKKKQKTLMLLHLFVK